MVNKNITKGLLVPPSCENRCVRIRCWRWQRGIPTFPAVRTQLLGNCSLVPFTRPTWGWAFCLEAESVLASHSSRLDRAFLSRCLPRRFGSSQQARNELRTRAQERESHAHMLIHDESTLACNIWPSVSWL